MKVEKDYEELLELLNSHKVKYCINSWEIWKDKGIFYRN